MRQYALVTASYWALTLTDGALRMLVVLHFHQLGYSPLEVALLFLFYEFFGMVTNLFGGWLGARFGLAATLISGLFLQVGALAMLLVDASMLTVGYVMVAQAFSGIAKDLTKMSAKSSVRLVAGDTESRLYRWVALLTGSKNALKGVGFFLGGALLAALGFQAAIATLAGGLAVVAVVTALFSDRRLGKTTFKPKFQHLWSKSPQINRLSSARLFLFGSRDVWFVVALPVFLQTQLSWSSVAVGTLLAAWVMGYGLVQTLAPAITRTRRAVHPTGLTAVYWGLALVGVPVGIGWALQAGLDAEAVVVGGLLLFGAVFAINSAVHSYLVVAFAGEDGVSLDVGYYYMSNAAGRLLGTVLSGWVFQSYGFAACLFVSGALVAAATVISLTLPRGAALAAGPPRAEQ